MEEMISEKKLRFVGSSGSSKTALARVTEGGARQQERHREEQESAPTLCMLVTESSCPHITESEDPLGAAVDEVIAMMRVVVRSRNDFRQLFHVRWLDVDDVCEGEEAGVSVSRKPRTHTRSHSLKLSSVMSWCQTLMRRSSADRKVS